MKTTHPYACINHFRNHLSTLDNMQKQWSFQRKPEIIYSIFEKRSWTKDWGQKNPEVSSSNISYITQCDKVFFAWLKCPPLRGRIFQSFAVNGWRKKEKCKIKVNCYRLPQEWGLSVCVQRLKFCSSKKITDGKKSYAKNLDT